MSSPLVIRAGPEALRILRQGWDWRHFDVIVGASGGPKWLALSALDRLLVKILERGPSSHPVHLLGSSSGAWRFLAYCLPNPEQALKSLEEAYIEANWDHNRPLEQRRQTARGILQAYSAGLERGALEQERFRLHVVTAHCRGLMAAEPFLIQLLGIALTGLLMAWRRWAMGGMVQRALFSDPRDALPASLEDVPSRRWPLRPDNLAQVYLASGSIPLVLPGVRDLPGGPGGALRDGGLVDYHFDHVRLQPRGLVLYPHFADKLMPSWLEHYHRSSPRDPEVTRRMVLIHPTEEWIAGLPGGKLPDRNDAHNNSEPERRRRWHEAARRGEELAECLEREVERATVLPL